MKKLLITSAMVAVSGAAVAEITWTGDAEFGWRSHIEDPTTPGTWIETGGLPGNGLYIEAGLNATASAELDNGISASIDYGLDLDYDPSGTGGFTLDNFPTLTFESSVGKLVVGDVDHAAHAMWDGANAPSAMASGFTENGDELVAYAETSLSGFAVGGSYTVADYGTPALTAGSLTFGAKGEMMGANFVAAYEINDLDYNETMGIAVGYTWNGIRGAIAYTTNNNGDGAYGAQYVGTNTSIGLSAGYEMQNGLDIAASIAMNDFANGTSSTSYDLDLGFEAMGADITLGYEDDGMGNSGATADVAYTLESAGMTIYAGYDFGEADVINIGTGAYYIGTEYSLGNGASVFASYATGNEMGDPEYDAGAALGVKLSF